MVVKAQPLIEIDGAPVSCGAADIGIAPVVMDDLRIQRGREDYFSHTEPAQLSIRLWDSTGEWATRIRSRRAIGAPVEAYWNAPTGRRMLFRGSVAHAKASRTTRTDFRNRHVWEIRLTAMDPIAAMGNVFPVRGILGAQSMSTRAAWLKGLLEYGGVKVSEIEFVPLYADASTWPLPVGEDSALDLIEQFYGSLSNDTWTYDAHENVLKQAQRLDGSFTTFLAAYDDARGAVLISAGDHTPATQTVPRPGISLAGCDLGIPEGLEVEATPASALNSVEIKWKSWDSNERAHVDRTTATRQQKIGEPLRTLSFDSWLREERFVKISLGSAWERAQAEGANPLHTPIRFRAGKDFPTERIARWWLTPWEDARPAFINGDALHSWLSGESTAWPPLVSPIGGELVWRGDTGWDIECRIAWLEDHTAVTPMTWANLQQLKWTTTTEEIPWWWKLLGVPPPPPTTVGTPTPERDIKWGPPTGTEYRFDTSVTWGDLRFLDNTTRQIEDIFE